MKKSYYIYLLLLSFIFTGSSFAQSSFNIENYKQFLLQNENMTASKLYQLYPAGNFKAKISSITQKPLYYDSIQAKYMLTDYEKSLITKNGFMVTERLNYKSFGEAFVDVFNKDMPLFISTDAILHAVHNSYDRILKDVEQMVIIAKLKAFLSGLHSKTRDLDLKYAGYPEMKNSLMDFDVYCTVALQLLGENESPYYSDNNSVVSQFITYINAEKAVTCSIFGNSPRNIDFSQFKPRGHYASAETPILAKYFRTMIWLGKIEFYLIPPRAYEKTDPKDVRRQSADAMLVLEAAELAGSFTILNELEDIIGFFVGEQDNVTLPNLKTLKASTGISGADKLLDSLTHKMFCDTLKNQSFAFQKILSQILTHDPFSPDSIMPASAFMPLGQRFVIDSYIAGNVVYDKLEAHRMLPSTLDILFALGNDAAGKLLQPELDKFKYSKNLAGLRYLLDSYGQETWNSTIYNMWLNSLRKLNPPENKTSLPEFMQTAAYWQQKMNTQLSSWTELRHDNLLYAKQSYSGGVMCSYPYSYVEPIPDIYQSLKVLAERARDKFNTYDFNTAYGGTSKQVVSYFDNLAHIADTLAEIAQKELNNIPLSNSNILFLKQTITRNQTCGSPYIGWYTSLFYADEMNKDGFMKQDYLVADVHTSPTDEYGAPIGWVKHSGTGPVNMGVWIADLPGNQKIAFTGPVMSYYEYTTTNFLRLSDQDWNDKYMQGSARPDFVNLYLANETGLTRGAGADLTGVFENQDKPVVLPNSYLTAQNYPNPFNPSTIISFTIPYDLANQKTELSVYNIQGEKIKTLVNEVLPSGNYFTRWDGKNGAGISVASGIYIYNLKTGGHSFSGKMNLIK